MGGEPPELLGLRAEVTGLKGATCWDFDLEKEDWEKRLVLVEIKRKDNNHKTRMGKKVHLPTRCSSLSPLDATFKLKALLFPNFLLCPLWGGEQEISFDLCG